MAGSVARRVMWGWAMALVLLGGCAGAALGQASEEPSEEVSPVRPAFERLRYEEEYQALRHRARRTSPWARVKYVPLAGDAFLSLGGEARFAYETFDGRDWGGGPDDGYLLQRYHLHADVHAGRLRAFGQLIAAFAEGVVGGPGPVDEDQLDLHQGFVDVVLGDRDGWTVTLRPGRQELLLGTERLVSVRAGRNVRRTFDAARVLAEGQGVQAQALVARPVVPEAGAFDNAGDADETFWGVYVSGQPADAAVADVYYLGLAREDAPFDQGVADETRHTLGLRLAAGVRGASAEVEAAYQFGDFGGGRIRAWTVATDVGYVLPGWPLRPAVGLKANVASGDGDPGDEALGTFNPLYPSGGYFGGFGLAPLNLMALHPRLSVAPVEGVEASVDVVFFWRHRATDGLYEFPGLPLRASGAGAARYAGHQPTLALAWAPWPYARLGVEYTWFPAGAYLEQAGPGQTLHYVALTLTGRF